MGDIRDLPVYVISLADRKDRWNRFTSLPAIQEFRKLQKVTGVNGQALSFKRDRKISIHTKYNILRNYRRSHYEIATLGAVGASMSHINAWKRFYASGKPVCLIMEDDARWDLKLIDDANGLYGTLPNKWGVWLLGHHAGIIFESLDTKDGWNRAHTFTGAHSYMLTRQAAKSLLDEAYPIETHIEYYMAAASAVKNVEIVQHPDVCVPCGQVEKGIILSNSNTVHNNGYGCPSCNIQDDFSQLYSHFTQKGTNGIHVSGALYKKHMRGGRRTRRQRHRV